MTGIALGKMSFGLGLLLSGVRSCGAKEYKQMREIYIWSIRGTRLCVKEEEQHVCDLADTFICAGQWSRSDRRHGA